MCVAACPAISSIYCVDFITLPDRNEVRESGQEVMSYFMYKCP